VHSANKLSVPRNAADRLRWWMGGGSLSSLIERLTSRTSVHVKHHRARAHPVHQQPCPMVRCCSLDGPWHQLSNDVSLPAPSRTPTAASENRFLSHPALQHRHQLFLPALRGTLRLRGRGKSVSAWSALCGYGVDGMLQAGPQLVTSSLAATNIRAEVACPKRDCVRCGSLAVW
jgi:hypothetical protein